MTDFTIRQEQLFFSLTMYEKEMKNTKHKLNKRSSQGIKSNIIFKKKTVWPVF